MNSNANEKKIEELKTRNFLRDVRNDREEQRLRLSEIPVQKMYEQAMYIDATLLPAVERKSGKDSADYRFFEDVYRSLLYAIIILDEHEYISRKGREERQLRKFYASQVDLLEKELTKYTTINDVFASEAIDHIAYGVAQRARELINQKNQEKK